MSKILVVDDEQTLRYTLEAVLETFHHSVVTAASGPEALQKLDGIDLVITDLRMKPMDGHELVAALRERDAALPIIMLTANGDERDAIKAVRNGAYDFIHKPWDNESLKLTIERALETRELRVITKRLSAEQAIGKRIVSESPSMRRLSDAITRVAARDVTVLVRGETGTGKELVGSLLHAQSHRASKPLVRFNCAAIPGELAEAELFGHVKGAFTGASGTRRGFFAEADGGTLVLDEIGELPLPIQAKLLRALQEGEIQPVGSGRVEKVDVRIVALTNRDLLAEARAGRFREDLYYRLAVIELTVAPLRERREDIASLAGEFVRRYSDKFGVADVRLSPEVVATFQAAPWPGNVRELENTVARLIALSAGGLIDLTALRDSGWQGGAAFAPPGVLAAPPPPPLGAGELDETGTLEDGPSLKEQVEAFERALVARALSGAGGNQSEAARRLRTSRVTLIDKMKKYGLAERGGHE